MPLPTDFIEGDPREHVTAHNDTNVKVNDLETDQHDPAEAGHGWHAGSTAHSGAATAAVATHEGTADPHGGYQKESEKGQPDGYASLDGSGFVPDGQLPAGIARDAEVTAVVVAHEGDPNPHAVYLTAAEGNAAYDPLGTAANEVDAHEGAANPHAVYLTQAEADPLYESDGAVATHEGAANPHAVYLTQAEADPLYESDGAVATHEGAPNPHPTYETSAEAQAKVDAHAGAADPHAGYQKETEKGVADGYASLDATGFVPDAQIPATIARDSELPDLAGHQSDPTAAHAASAVSYAGSAGLSATDVEAALDELDTEKSGTAHTHTDIRTVGGPILDPTGPRAIMVWRAPFACTVTNVRGHREGGTGAIVNARRNQTNDFLASDLSLTSADQWMDGGAVQNTAIAAGDDIEIELVSIAGAVVEVVIQVDLTRP